MALSLAFVVGAIVLYFNFTKPAYEDFFKIRGEQVSRKEFVENQEVVVTQVKKLIDAFREQGGIQERVSLSLPNEPDTGGALVQLHGLTQLSRFSAKSFGISVSAPRAARAETGAPGPKPITAKPLGTITLGTQFSGSYEDFKGFLNYLETNIRFFDLKNFSISPSLDKDNRVTGYQFNISVVTYFQAE